MSALIAYRNLADAATVTLEIGTEVAGFPLSNASTRQLSTLTKIKTTLGNPGIQLHVDLGAAYDLGIVAILATNYDSAGSKISTHPADFRITHSLDDVTWSSGILSNTDAASNPVGLDLPNNCMLTLDTRITARYLRIEPSWAIVGGDAIFGRLWISNAIIIPYGADSDWSIGIRERGTVDESAGLEVYPSAKRNGRELRMSFSVLDVAPAFTDTQSFQALHASVGAIGEVIALPRTSDVWPHRLGIYGRLSEDSLSIRHLAGPNYSTSMRVIEER